MSRLETYIATVLSRIEVDDAQRAEIERELRSHLEESIDRAAEQGLSREEAEDEAMAAFGDPTVLAKKFSLTKGFRWLVVERVIVGALLTWMCTDSIAWALLRPFGWAVFCVLAGLIWFLVARSLFNCVEVNGGLLVRRLGRKPLKVRFDEIDAVRFERTHLLGRRNIVLECPGGSITLGNRWRGVRAASLALTTLVPDRMSDRVRKFLTGTVGRVRRESVIFRIPLVLFWITALAALFLGAPSLLKYGDFNDWAMLALLAPFFTWFMQAFFFRSRGKRSLCWIFILVSGACYDFVKNGVIFGDLNLVHLGWALGFMSPLLALSMHVIRLTNAKARIVTGSIVLTPVVAGLLL